MDLSPKVPSGVAKPRIFISYAHADAGEFPTLAVDALGSDYQLVVDKNFMVASRSWTDQLEDSIRTSVLVIAVLSPKSVRRDAETSDRRDSTCHKELHFAFTQSITILPVMWKRCAPPFLVNDLHFIDFETLGEEKALDQLRGAIPDALSGNPIPRAYGIRTDWSLANWFAPTLAERSIFYGRQWLVDEIEARRNKVGPARLLLITGSTGTGKSSLVAKLKDDAERRGKLLGYHFCRYDVKDTLRPLNFLRNLVFMLRQELPEYRDALAAPVMENALAGLSKDTADKLVALFESLVIDPLCGIAQQPGQEATPHLILVDALDEAISYTGAALSIATLIEARLERLPRWIRWVVTCRPDSLAAEKLARGCDERVIDVFALDENPHPEDLDQFVVAAFEKASEPAPDERIRKLIRYKSGNNFQYVSLLVKRLLDGDWSEKDIQRAPPGLYGFYRLEFERLYPEPTKAPYRDLVAPMLQSIVAAREPLSSALLSQVTGARMTEFLTELSRLAGYLPEHNGRRSIHHKSLADWLTDPTAREYLIGEKDGDVLLANFCWSVFENLPGGITDLVKLEGKESTEYLVRHGVVHCTEAGQIARAVELLYFIFRTWNAESMEGSDLASVSRERQRRTLLRELEDCTVTERRALDPLHLASLVADFYQVEPLRAPLDILVRHHPEKWPEIRARLLAAGNYVVRFRTSDVLAAACLDPGAPVKLADVYQDLDSADINVRELGAYTVRGVYARRPDLIELKYLKRLADSDTYPGRSALGDLLVNLALQENPKATAVQGSESWQPIWDHLRLDVWDIKAAVPFMAAGRPTKGASRDSDADVRATYRFFQKTEILRRQLEKVEDQPKVLRLVRNFYKLGADPDEISETEEELKVSPRLEQLMRLFFSHPLWNVAETAASVLTSIIEKETDRQQQDQARAIVAQLLFGAETYWRVRFGAVETAYQLIAFDNMDLFGRAIDCFFKDRNSRVRALCAEDLVANILDRPPRLRAPVLKRFKKAIACWIKDEDCWVLEHVFRLLRTLEADGFDPSLLFTKQMPPLLDGLPKTGWDKLPRATFLAHIETRKREQLSEPA